MKTSTVAVCAAVLLGCMPATADADAITITDGELQVSPFGRFLDGFQTRLVSDNVTVRVFGLTGKPLNDPCVTSSCVLGDVRNFSSSVDVFDVLSFGTTLSGRSDPVWVSMHLALTAGDVAIADTTPFYMGVLLPPQPFTMSGRLTLRAGDLTTGAPGATVLDTLLTGQGTFRAYLTGAQGDGQPPFSFGISSFEFRPAIPAPTPEPATLLIVASGLVFVGRAVRRGRADSR